MTTITQIIETETKNVTFIEAETKIITGKETKIAKLEAAMTSHHGSRSMFMLGISSMITNSIEKTTGMTTSKKF